MLTQFSDSVYRALLQDTPGGRSVPRENLRKAGVPDVIAHFLEHALDRRIELDFRHAGEQPSDWIDADRDEVKLARQAYLRVLARYARFPAGEWPRALRQAVQLVCAYLVRPVPTLMHFVYGEGEQSLDSDSVLRRAGYFLPYPHLASTIQTFADRRPGQPLERGALKEALLRVDQGIASDYGPEEWSRSLGPLLQLAGLRPDDRGLPSSLLATFFDQKGARELAEQARSRGPVTFDRDGITTLLQPPPPADEPGDELEGLSEADLLGDPPEVAVPAQAAAPRPQAEAPPDAQATPPAPTAAPAPAEAPAPATTTRPTAADSSDDAQPIWMQFQGSQAAPKQPEPETPLWKRFQQPPDDQPGDPARPTAPAPAPAPRSASAPRAAPDDELSRRRTYFAREIFRGDAEAYDAFVTRMESAPDWQSASRFIGAEVFRRYQTDIYGDAAIAFTNAAERRFKST